MNLCRKKRKKPLTGVSMIVKGGENSDVNKKSYNEQKALKKFRAFHIVIRHSSSIPERFLREDY